MQINLENGVESGRGRTTPKTVILRHRKENLKKCSLLGLEERDDMLFLTYPRDQLPSLEGYIMLALEAPPLSEADRGKGIFLVDATWRYAEKMVRWAEPSLLGVEYRSIPKGYRTAYPRKQDDCPDPEQGLASVEALYLAYMLMGEDTEGLLEHYHWKHQFLESNQV